MIYDRYGRASRPVIRNMRVRRGNPLIINVILFKVLPFLSVSLVFTAQKPVVIDNDTPYLSMIVQADDYDLLLRNRTLERILP